jgi:hypothetical protein
VVRRLSGMVELESGRAGVGGGGMPIRIRGAESASPSSPNRFIRDRDRSENGGKGWLTLNLDLIEIEV